MLNMSLDEEAVELGVAGAELDVVAADLLALDVTLTRFFSSSKSNSSGSSSSLK